jgi:hypothetical protein
MNAYQKDIGAHKLIHDEDKVKTLMARWRYPSLSLHGISVKFHAFPNFLNPDFISFSSELILLDRDIPLV